MISLSGMLFRFVQRLKHAGFILRAFGFRALLRRALRKAGATPPARAVNTWKPGANSGSSILVIDEFLPFFDRSAGAKRIFGLVRLMREMDWTVYFLAESGGRIEPYATALEAFGVRLIVEADLESVLPLVDAAWLSRPLICRKYRDRIQGAGKAVIYDTVDIHHRRMAGAADLQGAGQKRVGKMRDLEFSLAGMCDAVVVTTPEERAYLQQHGVSNVYLVALIQEPRTGVVPAASQRSGMVMLGNYTHEPNVDAAQWFCNDIFPLVSSTFPGEALTIAGADPTRKILALRRKNVVITGFVPDIRSVLDQHRVFVAPLRYGAGLKGKILEALAAGIPVVTTPVGAEGIGLSDGESALIRETSNDFADAIRLLYEDDNVWRKLSQNGLKIAAGYTTEVVKSQLVKALQHAHGRGGRDYSATPQADA